MANTEPELVVNVEIIDRVELSYFPFEFSTGVTLQTHQARHHLTVTSKRAQDQINTGKEIAGFGTMRSSLTFTKRDNHEETRYYGSLDIEIFCFIESPKKSNLSFGSFLIISTQMLSLDFEHLHMGFRDLSEVQNRNITVGNPRLPRSGGISQKTFSW